MLSGLFLLIFYGGEGGIRTHGPLSWSTVFKTAAIVHSATSPYKQIIANLPSVRAALLISPPEGYGAVP